MAMMKPMPFMIKSMVSHLFLKEILLLSTSFSAFAFTSESLNKILLKVVSTTMTP
ncbi:hypothetical protein [Trichococcus collinsii]|uniref:Uncharacterized protein n=1 Tax=Trichococcus collinsii TaxID=157076 RepID=A0AB38A2R0_9LACT|nr:Hypothetical protein Tcol_1601 [Trichococcus collinsii]SEA81269.1 hypothetical protein SAMN04488525_10694 [Trichococcus collinsii]